MNALHQDLTHTVVVLKKEAFPPVKQALPYRLFRVTGGFGAQPHTIGRKIAGELLLEPGRSSLWKGDTTAMYDGFEVEHLATTQDMQALQHFLAQPHAEPGGCVGRGLSETPVDLAGHS